MMILVEVLIVAVLVYAVAIGVRAGVFSALGVLAGLLVGAAAVPWVVPWAATMIPDGSWRTVAVIGSAIVLLSLGAGLGASIGGWFRRGADRLSLGGLERFLGGVLGLVCGVVAVSLTGAGIVSVGIPEVSSTVASSTILRTIDRIIPEQVNDAVARLRAALLDDTVLPTIDGLIDEDILLVPRHTAPIDTDDPALQGAAASVARISGFAVSCGASATGSGFVVAPDRIVTNAHVVAGMDAPMVELPGEPARDGTVVYFDPADDLAVIAADVEAPPLPLDESFGPGDAGAVQGFPRGGPLRTVPADVLATGPASVADIYHASTSPRDVHMLETSVAPGNSGGPLLTPDGAVAGVIFALDEQRPEIGYALTTDELLPVLDALDTATERVPTGDCIP